MSPDLSAESSESDLASASKTAASTDSIELIESDASDRSTRSAGVSGSGNSRPLATSPDRSSVTTDDDSVEHEAECEEKVMSVIEHLEELRMRLLRSLAYVAGGIALALLITKHILNFLKAPAGNITFQALSLEEPVVVFLKVAFYTGLVIASPLVLFEICQFVAPGLTKKERKVLTPIIVGAPVLFVVGAAFAYYCVLPSMLHFFGSFGQGVIQVNQRLDFYVSLVSSFLLYMGLCFQLPLVIFAFSFTGLVNSKILFSVWRYAIFVAGIVAAVVTPDPTAFSMLITMGALLALYLLSIALLKLFGK